MPTLPHPCVEQNGIPVVSLFSGAGVCTPDSFALVSLRSLPLMGMRLLAKPGDHLRQFSPQCSTARAIQDVSRIQELQSIRKSLANFS